MTPSVLNKYALILCCLFLAACSGTARLPAGEKLYTGSDIRLESTEVLTKKDQRFITARVESVVRPLPNKSFLGMRPKLWRYTQAKWLRKWGEAPVLMSSFNPAVTSSIIDAALFNIGIFNSATEFKILDKERTAKVHYTSHIHKPYTVAEVIYSISDDSISRLLLSYKVKSLIVPGEEYNLVKLKNERVRMDALLKNVGYFYFSPDYLLFKADTSQADHSVTFTLTLKDSIPQNALTSYRINHVSINQGYSLNADTSDRSKDTVRSGVILRSVYIKKGELYSRKNHDVTLSRLMSMGNFKFVRVKFSESDTLVPGFLDAVVLMTPMAKRTLRFELDLVSKSNSFMGPRMNLSYVNRNTFKGAELLNVNMAGSYEAQFSGNKNNLYSYSLAPQIELYFPGFLVPFLFKHTSSVNVPRTRFLLSYDFMKRVNYFDMSTFNFVYGFKWKPNIRTERELNPVSVSYTSIANKSEAFITLLASNPFLQRNYEEQFLIGGNSSFTYNEQGDLNKKMQYFFHLATQVSGNAFSLFKASSQFFKISMDGRGYYNFTDKSKMAVRAFAGVGKSYGNSSTLPYTLQFFSGGPNSIRAFPINSLGPGTFHQNADEMGFLQLGGEVKLEANAEYRFNIFRYFKGALFVDAGNIWLINSNAAITAPPFSFSKFYKEIAVGAGVGLRIDVTFFVLRFDLATPLRKPWLAEDHRWVIDQMHFGSSSWRSENLILNVAIGYPF